MASVESYDLHSPVGGGNGPDDIDSLPSDTTTSDFDSEADREAQAEWDRSVQQLQSLMTMVMIPFVGKYFGRKFAFWSWAKWMECLYQVETHWTDKESFKAVGAVEVIATM